MEQRSTEKGYIFIVISKYLIVKISFVVLSVSTVLLYVLARNGTMTAVFGPILAYVVYLLNFALFIASTLFYFWRLKEYGETITIPINAMNPLRLPPVGTRATFAPIGNKDNRVIGVITEITNGRMTVAPAPTIKPSKPKLTAKTTTSN